MMKKKLTNLFIMLMITVTMASCSKKVMFAIDTDYLSIGFDDSGNIISMKDIASGKEYAPKEQSTALLSLYKDSIYTFPFEAIYHSADNQISLKYPDNITAIVEVKNINKYLRFELISLTQDTTIQAIVWGPYATNINQLIGETVGVVRDSSFAIGLQALDINTIEGMPDDGDNPGGGTFIDPLPGQHLPDSLRDKIGEPIRIEVNSDGDMPDYVRMYRGSLAVKKPYGSELRLFSRNRKMDREIGDDMTRQQVEAIDVDVIGSAIAFFGCPEPEVLNVIENIVLEEGLPHPMIDNVWIKRSRKMSQAYMLYEGKNMDHAIQYAKDLDFSLIHIGDVFESWGHFGLKSERFPNGAVDIRKFTDKAKENGISIGIHTLTTFTGVNDPYILPIPNDSLCKAGSTELAQGLGKDDDVIFIKDPTWFKNTGSTHTIKIGKELIAYRSVSEKAPWKLEGIVRGQFNTSIENHRAGEQVDKLVNNSYNGFLPDIHLQQKYAKRLAEVCQETGIDLMDFDGYEGLYATGHGAYGSNKFIDTWYKGLDRDRLVCGSQTGHYFWHIYSFMNWGEPWYSGLRQSQINYRIENQRYFQRNYMPGMLGWFKLETEYRPEEVEWIQARSAAFDAGYLLRVDENVEKSGFKDKFFEAIREWQRARNTKAFSMAQIEKFKDPKNEFHLKKIDNQRWELYPVSLQLGYEHKFRQVQVGEPIVTKFRMNNTYATQPIQFYLEVTASEGNKSATVSNLKIEINNYQSLQIGELLRAGDKLFCDGRSIYLCDATWNKVKEVKSSSLPEWSAGENGIVISSLFSGPEAPKLKFDFKTVGKPEIVATNKQR